MPSVLMVILVISLLGTALWYYSMTDVKHVIVQEKAMQAHYLARSGAELVAGYAVNNFESLIARDDYPWISGPYNLEGNAEKHFSVRIDKQAQRLVIQSTGEVDGVTQTLTLEIDSSNNRYWSR